MKLTNTVVTITVTIPEIEVDKELGLDFARYVCLEQACQVVSSFVNNNAIGKVTRNIIDCPDYPALCD